ncbi:hypothetical protein [Bacillus thuringiensis]|uniref:hypothetical protein n=1 Tax=Bacillus thuringiensis TaxID=1428 RepID=UPI0021757B22|nr:hypothetical protein [Bacillus thuringiensis]
MNKTAVILSFVLMLGIVGICSAAFTQKNTPIASEKIEVAKSISSKENKTEEVGYSELISVKKSDKNKFTEEGWKEVLKKIESGEVYWEK